MRSINLHFTYFYLLTSSGGSDAALQHRSYQSDYFRSGRWPSTDSARWSPVSLAVTPRLSFGHTCAGTLTCWKMKILADIYQIIRNNCVNRRPDEKISNSKNRCRLTFLLMWMWSCIRRQIWGDVLALILAPSAVQFWILSAKTLRKSIYICPGYSRNKKWSTLQGC